MLEAILKALPRTLTVIVVPLALVLLRRYFPPIDDPPTGTDLVSLDRRFHKTQWGVAGLWIAEAVAFALLTHICFIRLNRWFAFSEGPAVFRLYPSGAMWWIFPGFGALTIGWLLMEASLPLLLGSTEARVYLYWTNKRAGMSGGTIMRWGTALIAAPIGVLTMFVIPAHTTFHDSEMRFRGYGAIHSVTHGYSQIHAITTTDGFRDRFGNFVSDPRILLDFDDGTRWSSRDGVRDPDRILNVDLREFLVRKTGLPTQYVRIDRDLSAR
jgi:hypothetical protein